MQWAGGVAAGEKNLAANIGALRQQIGDLHFVRFEGDHLRLGIPGRHPDTGSLKFRRLEPDPVPGRTHGKFPEVTEKSPGVYEISTTGNDPYVATVRLEESIDPAALPILAFEYFCPDGVNDFTVYFGPPISDARSVSAGALPKAEPWVATSVNMAEKSLGRWEGDITAFRLDPGTKPGLQLQIRNLRLRQPNEMERKGAEEVQREREAKEQLAGQLTDYLAKSFPATIDEVTVRSDEAVIRGTVPPNAENYALAEIRLEEQPWTMERFSRTTPLPNTLEGNFTITVPRLEGSYDRLLSRWALVRTEGGNPPVLASHAVYPTVLSTLASANVPTPVTRSKKGMGGIEYIEIIPELAELGVEHVTINVAIDNLIALDPSKNAIAHEVDRQTYWIRRDEVEKYDRLIGFCSAHGMVVSAIILVGFPANPELRKALVHPESDSPGVYGMPNLTTPDGVRIYHAVLDFLAQRYASADGPHGLIANWILHNEVDYAWTWSNMGWASSPWNSSWTRMCAPCGQRGWSHASITRTPASFCPSPIAGTSRDPKAEATRRVPWWTCSRSIREPRAILSGDSLTTPILRAFSNPTRGTIRRLSSASTPP